MANPFLMMDEDIPSSTNNDAVANPFLMQDGQTDDGYDNPFIGQATNPFADFGDGGDVATNDTITSVPPTTVADIFMAQNPPSSVASDFQSIDAAMSFFGTTIEHDDEANTFEVKHPNLAQFDDTAAAYSSEEELSKKKAPPPRPVPPPQTTQELIFAVADQLDQASCHMLNRLPKTRSPSPVSMRDLHSPSPTPDVDLLDVSDDSRPPTSQGNIFDMDINSDNPFAPTSVPIMQAAAPIQPPIKNQPPRPPPPRPVPPRPSPPSATIPVQQQHQQQQQQPQQHEPDLFDMFGDSAPPPKPPVPKSKEDILSLFAAPKPQQLQQAQPDLLSGDIDDISSSDAALPLPFSETITQPIMPPVSEAPLQQKSEVNGTVIEEKIQPEQTILATSIPPKHLINNDEPLPLPTLEGSQPTTTVTEPDQPEPVVEEVCNGDDTQVGSTQPVMDSITPEVTNKRAPTPDIEITTVESLPRSDDEEEPPEELEHDDIKAEAEQSPQVDSNATTHAIAGSPVDINQTVVEPMVEPEQMDTGLDFAPSVASGSASVNPFASPESEDAYPQVTNTENIFATKESTNVSTNIFASEESMSATSEMDIFGVQEPVAEIAQTNIFAVATAPAAPLQTDIFGLNEINRPQVSDLFDVFSAKFDSAKKDNVSLLDGFGGTTPTSTGDAWGESSIIGIDVSSGDGFGAEEGFDSFLAMKAPELEQTMGRKESVESLNEDKEFNVVIRPKEGDTMQGIAPILAPPPRGSQNNSIYSGDSSPRINPFDKGDEVASAEGIPSIPEPASMIRTDSQETPPTPLFDEDVSQPLEDFPRINYTGSGWEMQLRQPNKKKITGQRFWKKIFLKLVFQGDNPVLQLYNQEKDKEPFQELPLQPSYSVSDIGAQQYDQFGKIFTVKLQYIFYKERPGVRPGQVTKAERLTNKLSQFAAYAIQGDYQGVKEFGSDLKKLGLPVEHAPQVSQLFKIGSTSYEDLKQFSVCVEEALFKLSAHRDRALTYKFEEVQITVVDELYVEQEAEGHITKQIARVRLFFLGFLSGATIKFMYGSVNKIRILLLGMPTIELGMNDLWRQGKEVVGRHDIIPVVTEEWIRLEGVEFHNCVQQDEYERSRTIKFQPPDACYIELMRFRVRPPKNRELPLQLKATWCVTGNRVELRADVLVPGFASRKLGQIPCEDVAIRFPIPECWIYLFRVEKHFRYGSVKSAHRRTGKIKGIERILGTVDTLQESLIEVTSGQAKYEHQHRAIVWRCPRLPKEGQGAYTTHQLVCRMALTSFDQIPEQLAPYCYVEFTMPATQVSHTTCRSVSVQDSDSDEPPEKYVRYLARHEYRVGIESTTGESPNAYLAATRIKEEPATPTPQPVASPMAPSDSDSESN